MWLVLALVIWAVASNIWSADTGNSFIETSQLLSMVILAFLALQLADRKFFLYLLIPAILCGAGFAAIIGIFQYYGFNPLDLRLNHNQMASTFINRNHAANYFDFIPPLAFVSLLTYTSKPARWTAALILGLVLAYILLNKSRGSVIALFVSIVLVIFLAWNFKFLRDSLVVSIRNRKRELLLALCLPIILLVLPTAGGKQSQDWRMEFIQGQFDTSTSTRTAIYLNSIPAILDHPLTGLGYGGVRIGFLPYTTAIKPVPFRSEDVVLRELHNDLLQYFVELGLPGGFLVLLIFGLVLRRGWQALNNRENQSNHLIVLGLLLAIITSAAHSLVDFPMRLPASAAMFWLCLGLFLGFTGPRNTSRIYPIPLWLNRVFVVAAGTGGVIFSLLLYKSYLISNHDLYKAAYHLQKKECLPAAAASSHGLKTFPDDFMLRTVHAQIYTACSFPPEQKFSEMNRILKADSTILRARLTRALLLNDALRPDLAVPELMAITKLLPHRATAYAGLGDSARLQGDSEESQFYYRAAIRKNPDYLYAIKQLEAVSQ